MMSAACFFFDDWQHIPFFAAAGYLNISSEQSNDKTFFRASTKISPWRFVNVISQVQLLVPLLYTIKKQSLELVPLSPISPPIEITALPVAVVAAAELLLILESNACLLKSFAPVICTSTVLQSTLMMKQSRIIFFQFLLPTMLAALLPV